MLKVHNKNIIEQTQQFIKWDQNSVAIFRISFEKTEIIVTVNDHRKNTLSFQRYMETPNCLTLGDP